MIAIFVIAAVLVALAELGDKTQLLALVLATRYRPLQVLLGITIATLLVHLISTAGGELIGRFIPAALLAWITGILFIGFGAWTLRGDSVDDEESRPQSRYGPVLTSGIAFFLAELGDKTQIMTMSIAADPAAAVRSLGDLAGRMLPAIPAVALAPWQTFLAVWMGSTVGMVLADGIAILVGSVLGKRLPEKLITRISGSIFIAYGVVVLVARIAGGG